MIQPYYENDGITIYHGDLLDVLPQMGCVDGAAIVHVNRAGKGFKITVGRIVPQVSRRTRSRSRMGLEHPHLHSISLRRHATPEPRRQGPVERP